MRRALAAFPLIVALWTAALAAFQLLAVEQYAPNTGYVVLLVGLWLTALVVYATLLNREGRFSHNVIVATVSLAAASVLVGALKALLTLPFTHVPPR
jgi:hypothetical protein